MKSFAIVIVCFNRIHGVKRLVKCLENADYQGRNDINLVFSIDRSDNSKIVDFAEQYNWKHGQKVIRVYPQRQGLKNHILQCGDITDQYDIVTILEDDLYVSDSFFSYAYSAAEYYWDDDNISGISLYNFQKHWLNKIYRFEPQKTIYDSYFLKVAQSWGQVWTKKKWQGFRSWYSQNELFTKTPHIPASLNVWPETSWLKYYDRYCIETNRYFVYPYLSFTTNFNEVGQHANRVVNDHQVELQYHKKLFSFSPNDKNAIRYDEYMEREGLGYYLGVDDKELTVDIWGTKNHVTFKKYVLTSKPMNKKILNSYLLSLRPIELAVINNLIGNDIKLYDTTIDIKNNIKNSRYKLIEYSIRSHDFLNISVFLLALTRQELLHKSNRLFTKLKLNNIKNRK